MKLDVEYKVSLGLALRVQLAMGLHLAHQRTQLANGVGVDATGCQFADQAFERGTHLVNFAGLFQ